MTQLLRFCECVLWIAKNVDNLNCFAFERHTTHGGPPPWRDGMTFVKFPEFARIVKVSHTLIDFTVTTKQQTTFRLAQANSRLDQRIEHALEIERRTADDFEHVGGCGLLLEGFA